MSAGIAPIVETTAEVTPVEQPMPLDNVLNQKNALGPSSPLGSDSDICPDSALKQHIALDKDSALDRNLSQENTEPARVPADSREATDALAWQTRTVRGGKWIFAARVVQILCTLAVQLVLSRQLSQADYGMFNVACATTLFLAIMIMGGLNYAAVRVLPGFLVDKQTAAIQRFLRGGYLTLAASTLLTMGGIWLSRSYLPIVNRFSAELLVVVLCGATLMAWQQFTVEALRGMHDLRSAALFHGGKTNGAFSSLILVCAILLWPLLIGGSSLLSTIWLYTAAIGLTLPMVGWLLWYHVRQLPPATDKNTPQDPLADSIPSASHVRDSQPLSPPGPPRLWPLALSFLLLQVLAFLQGEAELWLAFAAWGANSPDLGLYSAARWIIILISLPLTMINQTISPSIVDLRARGNLSELQRLLRGAAFAAGIPSLLALAGICLFPGLTLSIFGDYQSAAWPLFILAVGQFFYFWTGSAGITLMMSGHEWTILAINVLSAALLLIAGAWGAAHYGMTGLAVVSSSVTALMNLAQWLAVWRLEGLWTHFSLAQAQPAWVFARRQLQKFRSPPVN
ncbi:MAG: lipopolysaccharide biosynthesis protein [Pirellulales bacterium]|nr:lipopolysaccharide biosynthesis protein [Pirellulales bacterium]